LVWARSTTGSAAQVFVVQRARTHYSDHLTPVPLFAAFLLLPSPLLVATAALTFVPEWLGYHRKWFVQLFNVASWIIALTAGRLTLVALSGKATLRSVTHLSADPIATSLLVVPGVQTSPLAAVLRLARRQRLRQTGLLNPSKLFADVSLLCAGWVLAVVWLTDPLYVLAALVPLVLMF
jgi:hypothetical protein